MALDHPDGQDWPQTAGDVLADTMRLSALAEDLLVLARLDEADQPRAAQRVELNALAADVVSRYPDAPVPVVLAQAEPCQLAGDPDGLRRMLGNLIDNAARYARTQVAVSVTMDGAAARLCVADDGPGIPPRDRERAFGRFTRLEAARSRDGDDAGGAGLGLAIVRATARAHGGSVWLEDAAPGLRAVVLLPGATRSAAATVR